MHLLTSKHDLYVYGGDGGGDYDDDYGGDDDGGIDDGDNDKDRMITAVFEVVMINISDYDNDSDYKYDGSDDNEEGDIVLSDDYDNISFSSSSILQDHKIILILARLR